MNVTISDIFTNLDQMADPRVNDFFLMKSPWELIGILVLYLSLIFLIGPAFMKNREPWKLRKVLIGYNILQIFLNALVFYMIYKISSHLNFLCTPPVDSSNTSLNKEMIQAHYAYTLLKIVDMLDTAFFVLRKKYSQITFLHVHHHSGVLASAWISLKYFPGGHAFFVGLLNSFVHVIMYSYYLITVWSSEYAKTMWWTRYLTQLQIAQHYFVLFVFLAHIVNPSCSYPKLISAIYLVTVVWMIIQFTQFYNKRYGNVHGKKSE